MSKKIGFLMFLLLISCCRKPVQSSLIQPTKVFITTELIVDNFSEDITGNDELQLIIFHLKDSVATPILLNVWQDTLLFHKNDGIKRKPIVYQMNNIDNSFTNSQLVFLLLEIDGDRTPKQRLELVNTILLNSQFQDTDSLAKKMEMAIKDDDLLGIKFLKLGMVKAPSMGTIVFSGSNLFDKYHYRLNYLLK